MAHSRNNYVDSVTEHVSFVFSSVRGTEGGVTSRSHWKNKINVNISTTGFSNGKLE